jgi:hypothetical protein
MKYIIVIFFGPLIITHLFFLSLVFVIFLNAIIVPTLEEKKLHPIALLNVISYMISFNGIVILLLAKILPIFKGCFHAFYFSL